MKQRGTEKTSTILRDSIIFLGELEVNMLTVRSFGFLVTFLGILVIGNAVLYAAEQYQIYSPKTLIFAKWGPSPNEFGLKEGKEMETIGPRTFSLDRSGNIYIFDLA